MIRDQWYQLSILYFQKLMHRELDSMIFGVHLCHKLQHFGGVCD